MIFHLYDNSRQHLAMSESFEELQGAALLAFQEDDLPYAYIRWSDAAGQQQELRVTEASIAEARRLKVPSTHRVQVTRSHGLHPSARQRANLLTGVAIAFLVLFLTSEIAAIILRKPLSVAIFGY